MSFLSRFRKAETESVMLIDISSGSIGAAYASHGVSVSPTLHHAVRFNLTDTKPETVAKTLKEAIGKLVTDGAPHLRDATGSGRASRAVVAVSSPWQETVVRTLRKESPSSFTFTRSTLASMTNAEELVPEGHSKGDASVIAVVLNGYEVREPFGKRTSRAEAVVVSSSIETVLVDQATTALRDQTHIRSVEFMSYPRLTFGILRDLYPHERDYLIVDAGGRATDIALISRGLLTRVASAPVGTRTFTEGHPVKGSESIQNGLHLVKDLADGSGFEAGKKEWLTGAVAALKDLAEHQALPRTIFLISEAQDAAYLKGVLDDSAVRSLWLSDSSLSVITVQPANLQSHVAVTGEGMNDVPLLISAVHLGKKR